MSLKIDSNGKWTTGDGKVAPEGILIPGFVDAHCHILPTGLDLQKLHLGTCNSKEDVLDAVRSVLPNFAHGEWIHAVHYDQTKFADATHLTRDDLDRVATDHPVLLRHSNGHASVANSVALKSAGIPEDVENPTGGEFVRDASGRLTGVLLERAHEFVTAASPRPTTAEMTSAILVAAEKMSALGITCATDMMTGRWHLMDELDAYQAAAEQGAKVRLRLCIQWATVFGPRVIGADALTERIKSMPRDICDVIGIKIFADGAIGSASAAIYGKYLTTGGDGQLIYAPERLKSMVQTAHDAGFRLAIHTIGDRSTDLVMDAYEATGDPSRHRIEHAMILSDEQIERIASLGCKVSMQPEFLKRFGHAYQKQLEAPVAKRIKRVKSVLDAGIPLSFSSDRPIVPGNPWDGIEVAVQRPEFFDQSENVDLETAIRLYTKEGASANYEAGTMGEIKEGAWADFQVYDSEPQPGTSPKAVFLAGLQVQ